VAARRAGSVGAVRVNLVPELSALVDGGRWEACRGSGRATTWRVEFDDKRPGVVVKAGVDAPSNAEVAAEAERLAWLDKVAPASELAPSNVLRPQLLGQQPAAGDQPAALVTAELVGVPELHWFLEGPEAANLLGSALREVHQLPVADCPFDAGPRALVDAAEARVMAGLIDPVKFHAAHQRYSPVELLSHVKALMAPEPDGDDRVVIHGDWSVGNVLARPDTRAFTGIVDWGGLGVGDRHFDLGAAARSLISHFGGEVLPRFLAAYGFDDPDPLRLDFYVLLDQFR